MLRGGIQMNLIKDENLKTFITEISKNIGAAVNDMNWDLESQLVKLPHGQ